MQKSKSRMRKMLLVATALSLFTASLLPGQAAWADETAEQAVEAGQGAGSAEAANTPLAITHTPEAAPVALADYSVTATVAAGETAPTVTLYYSSGDTFTPIVMAGGANDGAGNIPYSATIPQAALAGQARLSYYIEASDGETVQRAPADSASTFQLNIAAPASQPEGPYLLITEIVFNARTAAGDSAESYEYVELYNNSTQPIPLNQYDILYGYPDPGSTPVALPLQTEKVLQPAETVVLWNRISSSTTDLAQFNANYGVNLAEDHVVPFGNYGFTNNAERNISIVTRSGDIVAKAIYNLGGSGDDQDHRSITYHADPAGGTLMAKLGSKQTPTPGSLVDGQAPAAPVALPNDFIKPAIYHTPAISGSAPIDLTVSADVTDDQQLAGASLHYKTDKMDAFTSVPMASVAGSNYEGVIPQLALLDASYVDYYIEATDGTNLARAPRDSGAHRIQMMTSDGTGPYLLLTEVVFNARNAPGASAESYEYVELYNNSNRSIPLGQYKVLYGYPNVNTAPVTLDLATDKVMKPGETVVLWNWIEGSSPGLNEFNGNYGTSLTESQIVRFGNYNFINSAGRSISIATDTGEIISTLRYNSDAQGNIAEAATENQDHTSITYKMADDGGVLMAKLGSKVAPTPGTLLAEQKPASFVTLPEDFLRPIITHNRPFTATVAENTVISAVVTDDHPLASVKLFYKRADGAKFEELPMQLSESAADTYEATLTKGMLLGSEMITYYIETSDGTHTTRYPANNTLKFQVSDELLPVASQLLITEVLPDNKGGDAYEYVEVYNNTNVPVNLRDYQIRYTNRYNDYIVWDIDTDTVIPAGQTGLIWVRSLASRTAPIDAFLTHHQIASFDPSRIADLFSDGMSNSEEGRVVLATDAGDTVSQAWFSVAEDEAFDDGTSIVYEAPLNGGTRMINRGFRQVSTPGQLLDGQVPSEPITLEEDSIKPVIVHTPYAAPQPPAHLSLEANVKDNQSVKKVTLFYKRTDEPQTAFRSVNATRKAGSDTFVSDAVLAQNLLNAEGIDYYFTASDGFQTAASETYRLQYDLPQREALRLNAADGDILSGDRTIIGISEDAASELTLKLDGTALPSAKSLPDDAYLLLEVNDMQSSFKNGLYINNEFAALLPSGNKYMQIAIPLTASLLKPGSNVITLTAGTSGAEGDPKGIIGNNDDYTIQSAKIVLPNGNVIAMDEAYLEEENGARSKADLSSPRIKIGDGSANDTDYVRWIDYYATLPADAFNAVRAGLDTETITDGNHTVSVTETGGATVEADIVVDNSIPVINGVTIKEGETYAGTIELNAEITDAVSGIASVVASVDGVTAQLPSKLRAIDLEAGEHTLEISATDKAGNTASHSVTFATGANHPDKPSEPAPADKAANTGANPTLSVKVNDENGDPLNVTFYEGERYDFGLGGEIDAFSNATDREPPLELVPAGESAFTEEDKALVASRDGSYMVTNHTEKFPYQRFDFTIDRELAAGDEIEIVWQGHSLPGRQVTVYTWNYNTGKWERGAAGIGAEDFELRAKLDADNMVKDGVVHVLVQDLIAEEQPAENFTFAWVSDTQYYSDSYPYIYKSVNHYIADQKEERNIVYSVHTGDLVDDWDRPDEWKVASDSQKILEEAGIPHGVVAGNHDVNHNAADYAEYIKYFGEDRYKDQPYYGGGRDNNRDHYDLISASGQDFIIVYLGWGIEEETIEWANEVLAMYPDRHAIIGTHEYISASGAYSGAGEKIWTEIVADNPNVFMVLCGHIHGAAYNVKHAPDGRIVVEMLADYQSGLEGGGGYIRFLEFDIEQEKIHVSTYSPYKDDENYYEDPGHDNFDVPFTPSAPGKQVATDYIGVNVYTGTKIGEDTNVASGDRASVTWSGRGANTSYGWYAVAADGSGGKSVSDVWTFTTGNSGGVINPPPSGGNGNGGGSNSADDRLKVNAADVADTDKDGKVVLTLQSGQQGAVFTADALAQLKQLELTIEREGLRVTMPSEYFSGLTLASGEQWQVTLTELANSEVNKAVASFQTSNRAKLKLAGETAAISAAIVDQDGKVKRSLALDKSGFVLQLDADKVRNRNLVAVYLLLPDGTVERIESEFEENRFTAIVPQDGSYAVMEYNKPYTDLPHSHWAYDYVQELSLDGLVQGMSETEFAPENAITRAQLVQLIVRMMGLTSSGSGTAFKDVAPGSWYEEAVAAAAEAGIVQGVGNGSFEPDRTVTREEMAVMLMKALTASGKQLEDSGASGPGFTDEGQISEWALTYVEQAAQLGLLQGRGGGEFAPGEHATRAEGAKVIYMIFTQTK
ncbi:S-layer homology domain-containing protein [Paenibacillus nanensis]|nr:S-layer homology domain-containing protein [Paenibacillus nanensis]